MTRATATISSVAMPDPVDSIPDIPPREFLDLTSKTRDEGGIQLLREILTTSRKIVVIAGAGISVAAGIPDFRSSKGMFAQMKSKGRTGQMMFDTSVYRSEDTIEEFHEMIGNLYEASVKTAPTPFHNLLESLAKSDRLLRLYTQNIDFLDTRHETLKTIVPVPPVGPWPKVIAVHGSLEKMTCTKCRTIKDFNPELFRIWKEEMPECNDCRKQEDVRIAAGKRKLGVGFIRPRMVLYGEPGYDAVNIGSCVASDLRNRPDALIVVGTTLKIPGTRTMVKEMSKAIGNRGHCIWLNVDEAPGGEFDDVWDFVIKGDCQKVAELMQNIPILPKDQSFYFEQPLDCSQETQKDAEMHHARNDFWHIVAGNTEHRSSGLLTPASSNPSTSDDERTSKRLLQKTKNKMAPVTTNAATFYAPLSTKPNPLKRKRPTTTKERKAVSAENKVRRKQAQQEKGKSTKTSEKRVSKSAKRCNSSLVVNLKIQPNKKSQIVQKTTRENDASPISSLKLAEPGLPLTPAPSFLTVEHMPGQIAPSHSAIDSEHTGNPSSGTPLQTFVVDNATPECKSADVPLHAELPSSLSSSALLHDSSTSADAMDCASDSKPTSLEVGSSTLDEVRSASPAISEALSSSSSSTSSTPAPTPPSSSQSRKRNNKWATSQPRRSTRLSLSSY